MLATLSQSAGTVFEPTSIFQIWKISLSLPSSMRKDIFPIPEMNVFQYQSLDQIRKDLKKTGLYSDNEIEEEIQALCELPEYKNESRSN